MEKIAYSVSRGNPIVQVKMRKKQREMGTESRLNACDESGGEREISICSILLARAVSLEVYNSIQRFIPSQQFYPLLVNKPENLSAQQKLTISNKLF